MCVHVGLSVRLCVYMCVHAHVCTFACVYNCDFTVYVLLCVCEVNFTYVCRCVQVALKQCMFLFNKI